MAAAIVERDGRILAVQRGYGDLKDWWEFPGGKVEAGETSDEACVRELREELGVDVEGLVPFVTVGYDYPTFHLTMDCFACHVRAGEHVRLIEHEAKRWLVPRDLGSVRWLPADEQVISVIQAGGLGEVDG